MKIKATLKKQKVKLLAISTMAVAGWGISSLNRNDKLTRNIYFWRNLMPIYMHYRYKELMFKYWKRNLSEEKIQEEYGVLHKKYAQTIYDVVVHLRGFYVKVGQMGAQRLDVIPKEWVAKLRNLENKMPYNDFEIVKEVIEENFKCNVEDIFSSFEKIPLGSASIGQVHKAILLKTNQTVAVKIINRDAKKNFGNDLKTLNLFARIARPDMLPFLEEIEHQILDEFDYIHEADIQRKVRANLQYKWRGKISIPLVYTEFCSPEVLVMEYFDGQKLSDYIISAYDNVKNKKNISLKNSELKLKTGKKLGEEFLVILNNFYDFINNLFRIVTFGLKEKLFKKPEILNFFEVRNMLDTLIKVHGYEIFADGIFNSDPHGGNVLVLKDGKLGLLDYGQSKELTFEMRKIFAKMIVALDSHDWSEVVQQYRRAGFRTVNDDTYVVEKTARMFFGDGYTGKMILPQYIEYLHKRDPVVEYPQDLVFVGKLAMILRGSGMHFFNDFSIAHFWRPFAEDFLKSQK